MCCYPENFLRCLGRVANGLLLSGLEYSPEYTAASWDKYKAEHDYNGDT